MTLPSPTRKLVSAMKIRAPRLTVRRSLPRHQVCPCNESHLLDFVVWVMLIALVLAMIRACKEGGAGGRACDSLETHSTQA